MKRVTARIARRLSAPASEGQHAARPSASRPIGRVILTDQSGRVDRMSHLSRLGNMGNMGHMDRLDRLGRQIATALTWLTACLVAGTAVAAPASSGANASSSLSTSNSSSASTTTDATGISGRNTSAATSGVKLAQATGVTYPREGMTSSPVDSKAAAQQQVSVPLATDFAAHARRASSLDVPLIVLVSLRDCVYCGPIRQRELAPLVRSGKYEVREIGMDSTAQVRDFDGSTTTGVVWARAHGVKVSPTVLFLDTNGRPVADPLIGAGLPDFYGAYLDDAIARGRARLHPASGTTTR